MANNVFENFNSNRLKKILLYTTLKKTGSNPMTAIGGNSGLGIFLSMAAKGSKIFRKFRGIL